jgi:hypothetical protein
MPIKTLPAKTYVNKYICDECGQGEMVRHNDIVLTSYPPQFPHKCTNCDEIKNFFEVYPQTTIKY